MKRERGGAACVRAFERAPEGLCHTHTHTLTHTHTSQELFEIHGGEDAFINIKYMIPTYESCVLN